MHFAQEFSTPARPLLLVFWRKLASTALTSLVPLQEEKLPILPVLAGRALPPQRHLHYPSLVHSLTVTSILARAVAGRPNSVFISTFNMLRNTQCPFQTGPLEERTTSQYGLSNGKLPCFCLPVAHYQQLHNGLVLQRRQGGGRQLSLPQLLVQC